MNAINIENLKDIESVENTADLAINLEDTNKLDIVTIDHDDHLNLLENEIESKDKNLGSLILSLAEVDSIANMKNEERKVLSDIISLSEPATDEELTIIRKTIVSDIVAQLMGMMKKKGMNRASLARKLNVSKANITLMFSGNINMSITCILKFMRAINPNSVLIVQIAE